SSANSDIYFDSRAFGTTALGFLQPPGLTWLLTNYLEVSPRLDTERIPLVPADTPSAKDIQHKSRESHEQEQESDQRPDDDQHRIQDEVKQHRRDLPQTESGDGKECHPLFITSKTVLLISL